MFPSYRIPSVDLQTGFYMMGTLIVKVEINFIIGEVILI